MADYISGLLGLPALERQVADKLGIGRVVWSPETAAPIPWCRLNWGAPLPGCCWKLSKTATSLP